MNATQRRAEEALTLHNQQRWAFGPAVHAVRALFDARQDARARVLARAFAANFGGDEASGEALYTLASEAPIRHYVEGEVIIAEGERSQDVYVVQKGEVRVERAGVGVVARLGVGQSFGEIAAFAQTPRTATCVAEGGLSLIQIERKSLGRMSQRAKGLEELLKRLYRNRLLSQLVGADTVFGGLDPEQRHQLFQRFEPKKVPPGVALVREGERAHGFYVLVTGRAVVYTGGKGIRPREDQSTLQPGDFCGEVSLLRDMPATATVEAVDECHAFFLRREIFGQILHAHPDAAAALGVVADERLRETRGQEAPPPFRPADAPELQTAFGLPAFQRPGSVPPGDAFADETMPLRGMTCPVCGFDQPEAPHCLACGVDVAAERHALHHHLTGEMQVVR